MIYVAAILKTFPPLLSPYEENPFEYNQNEIYQEVNVTDLWACSVLASHENHMMQLQSRERKISCNSLVNKFS